MFKKHAGDSIEISYQALQEIESKQSCDPDPNMHINVQNIY